MRLLVNGVFQDSDAVTLADLLQSLDLSKSAVATAINGSFIRRDERATTNLQEGDSIEIVAPMQGG